MEKIELERGSSSYKARSTSLIGHILDEETQVSTVNVPSDVACHSDVVKAEQVATLALYRQPPAFMPFLGTSASGLCLQDLKQTL